MTERMSTDLARRVAAHLREGLRVAEAAQWEAAPAVLSQHVRRFAEALETGDTSWVANSPFARSTGDRVADGHATPVTTWSTRGVTRPGDRTPKDLGWQAVDELRRRVAATLVRTEVTQLGGTRRVGYFAVQTAAGPVRFYRVTAPQDGQWDGRVFVDAQAGDDYHAVKNPASLSVVLGAIAEDPEGAAKLYARELGRCSRCARTLTDEESRAAGMGPDCRALAAR